MKQASRLPQSISQLSEDTSELNIHRFLIPLFLGIDSPETQLPAYLFGSMSIVRGEYDLFS